MMPHVGYSVDGVPLVLTAQSLKVLSLRLEELLPTGHSARRGLIHREFKVFFPYTNSIAYSNAFVKRKVEELAPYLSHFLLGVEMILVELHPHCPTLLDSTTSVDVRLVN